MVDGMIHSHSYLHFIHAAYARIEEHEYARCVFKITCVELLTFFHAGNQATFQLISVEELASYVKLSGGELDAIIASNGWTKDGDSVKIPRNDQNQATVKIKQVCVYVVHARAHAHHLHYAQTYMYTCKWRFSSHTHLDSIQTDSEFLRYFFSWRRKNSGLERNPDIFLDCVHTNMHACVHAYMHAETYKFFFMCALADHARDGCFSYL
jgi:hypothetical protein